jgi:predicted AAA+ superfamily ATPase
MSFQSKLTHKEDGMGEYVKNRKCDQKGSERLREIKKDKDIDSALELVKKFPVKKEMIDFPKNQNWQAC